MGMQKDVKRSIGKTRPNTACLEISIVAMWLMLTVMNEEKMVIRTAQLRR